MCAVDQRLVSCRICGQVHHTVKLRFAEHASCSYCGSALVQAGSRRQAAAAYAIAALILAVPATELPIVTVRKFGADRVSYVWTGVQALWQDGMHMLAIWVALCGVVVPILLLAALVTRLLPSTAMPGRGTGFWIRFASALQHWSMPEVQLLAVLVAFVKIGALVQVDVGPGLWFYGAMAMMTLLAWRHAGLPEAAL